MRLGKYILENFAVRVKRSETDRLKGDSILDVYTVALSLSINEDEGVFVAKEVFAGPRDEGEVGGVRRAVLRLEGLHLKVVHAWIYTIEHSTNNTIVGQRSGSRLLCSVVVGHPLKEPRIRVIMASYFEVDQHPPTQKCGAMLESFLACTRRNSERCQSEALCKE